MNDITLYYPRIKHGRYYWCRVVGDGLLVHPAQSCDERYCHGHSTQYGAVEHHAEWVANSNISYQTHPERMERCRVCRQWTADTAMYELDPYQDRIFICRYHSNADKQRILRFNHMRWRGLILPSELFKAASNG